MSTPRRVVYRALLGGYEQLREEEAARDSEIPFLCFTDDPGLTSETWQVVLVEPRLPRDSTRSARALKIIGHPVLDEYDETLWLDNTVALKRAPDELFDTWLADADVAAPLHAFRSSVLAEAEAVLDSGLDDFTRVYEQMATYLALDAEALEQNPHWTGMLARRRTPATQEAMRTWWEDVLRFSRRDQLSFVPAMRARKVAIHTVGLDTMESEWHSWPRSTGRDESTRGSGLREVLRPPAGRVGQLQQALDDTVHTMAVTVAQREELIAALETELAATRERADGAEAERARLAEEADGLRARLAASTAREAAAKEALQRRTRQLRRARRRLQSLQAEPAPPSWWRRLRHATPRVGRPRP